MYFSIAGQLQTDRELYAKAARSNANLGVFVLKRFLHGGVTVVHLDPEIVRQVQADAGIDKEVEGTFPPAALACHREHGAGPHDRVGDEAPVFLMVKTKGETTPDGQECRRYRAAILFLFALETETETIVNWRKFCRKEQFGAANDQKVAVVFLFFFDVFDLFPNVYFGANASGKIKLNQRTELYGVCGCKYT